jgi:hypothetical protein
MRAAVHAEAVGITPRGDLCGEAHPRARGVRWPIDTPTSSRMKTMNHTDRVRVPHRAHPRHDTTALPSCPYAVLGHRSRASQNARPASREGRILAATASR